MTHSQMKAYAVARGNGKSTLSAMKFLKELERREAERSMWRGVPTKVAWGVLQKAAEKL